jgi:hypothetical protein
LPLPPCAVYRYEVHESANNNGVICQNSINEKTNPNGNRWVANDCERRTSDRRYDNCVRFMPKK